MKLPYAEYKAQAPAFLHRVAESSESFYSAVLPSVSKCPAKEFSVMVRMEMLRAAAAYKRGGMESLESSAGPADWRTV